jgi:uncharacterized phage protein gp47/JayE
MYENVTFEDILQRTLARVSDTRDKREGAIIHDTHAPVAVELQLFYIELDTVLNEGFADTASLPYLIRRASEKGITQYPATKTILKMVSTPVDVEVPIGARFSLNTLNYVVIEKIADGEYRVECESEGAIGNTFFGTLIPIDYIEGLQTAEIIEVVIPGEDAEGVEALRKRYLDSLSSQAFGGNIADYKEKVGALDGVGGLKVYPAWNGGGTVGVTFIDSTFGEPSEELVERVQNDVDPVGHSGLGYGIAPIGHVVTVKGVEATPINIEVEITYAEGWSWDACASLIKKAVDDYFKELSKTWADNQNLIVRISQLESRILDCEGVLDVFGATLNGSATNFSLDEDSIPVRGEINGN